MTALPIKPAPPVMSNFMMIVASSVVQSPSDDP